MFDLNFYATDENLENNGTIFPLGKDSYLLIARAGNRRYSRAITKAVELRRLELEAGPNATEEALDAATKVSDEITIDVMAETILLGWGKLSKGGAPLPASADNANSALGIKGVPLTYSLENAKKALAIKDFRKLVAGHADNMEAFRLKEEVEAGKT